MIKHVKILVSSANPKKDLDFLEQEVSKVRQITRDMPGNVQTLGLEKGSFEDIFQALEEKHAKDVNFFHYCGHSSQEQIVLENNKGGEKRIRVTDFSYYLKKVTKLDFAFFNSCCSGNLGANLLEDSSLKAVVISTALIYDGDAAVFAGYFYGFLAKGKSIPESIELCRIAYENGAMELLSSGRRDVLNEEDEDAKEAYDEFPWKLKIKEGCEVEVGSWKFVPETIKEKLQIGGAYNVLCICSPAHEMNEEVYNSIDQLLARESGKKDVNVFSYNDLMDKEKETEVLKMFDTFICFLCPTFDKYWQGIQNVFQDVLDHKRIGLLYLHDGAEKSVEKILDVKLPSITSEIIPGGNIIQINTLISSLKVEGFMAMFCHDKISELIFQENLKSKLKKTIIHLNYRKQLGNLDPDIAGAENSMAKKFGLFNLIQVTGSAHCGQLLLVRKMLRLASVDLSHTEAKYEQVSKLSLKTMNEEALWFVLALVFEKNKDKSEKVNKLNVCSKINTFLDSDDLVVVLDGCEKLATQAIGVEKILQNFWKDFHSIIDGFGYSGKKRFFFFLINRNHCFDTKRDVEEHVFLDTPNYLGKSLASITPISDVALGNWYIKSKPEFTENTKFEELEEDSKLKKILALKHMKKVTKEICKSMGLMDTSFITDLRKK